MTLLRVGGVLGALLGLVLFWEDLGSQVVGIRTAFGHRGVQLLRFGGFGGAQAVGGWGRSIESSHKFRGAQPRDSNIP